MLRRAIVTAALGALVLVPLLGSHAGSAGAAETAGPAGAVVERTVVTQDGSMYRGEVVDYVIGDHITLKLEGGEIRRIPFGDAARISPPSPKGQSTIQPLPAPAPPPAVYPVTTTPPVLTPAPAMTGAVRPIIAANPVATVVPPGTWRMITLKDELTVNGEILEYEVGSHILFKLADGDKRRISWAETKKISPPHNLREELSPVNSPERTIVMRDGKTVRGELVESLLGEWTRLKLANGQFLKVSWSEAKRILLPQQGRGGAIPVTAELLVTTDNGSRIQGEYFEHIPDDHLVLRHANGRLRIIPVGTIRKIVLLSENASTKSE